MIILLRYRLCRMYDSEVVPYVRKVKSNGHCIYLYDIDHRDTEAAALSLLDPETWGQFGQGIDTWSTVLPDLPNRIVIAQTDTHVSVATWLTRDTVAYIATLSNVNRYAASELVASTIRLGSAPRVSASIGTKRQEVIRQLVQHVDETMADGLIQLASLWWPQCELANTSIIIDRDTIPNETMIVYANANRLHIANDLISLVIHEKDATAV